MKNVVSWPNGNSIEMFFSMVKAKYKRLRLQDLVNQGRAPIQGLVIKAAHSIPLSTIRNIAAFGEKVWSHSTYIEA